AEGLALAEETQPRLAVVDIKLTGPIDGIELACVLRQKFSIPAIFLSGLADDETTRRAQIAAPLGFLRKPFRPSQVFNAIEQALSPDGSYSCPADFTRRKATGSASPGADERFRRDPARLSDDLLSTNPVPFAGRAGGASPRNDHSEQAGRLWRHRRDPFGDPSRAPGKRRCGRR